MRAGRWVVVAVALVVLVGCGGSDEHHQDDGPTAESSSSASSPTASPGEDSPGDALAGASLPDSAERGARVVSGLGEEQAADMSDFMTAVIGMVDEYWVQIFASAGIDEPRVLYQFPEQGVFVDLTCGEGGKSDDDTAAYCPVDDAIVVSEAIASRVWKGLVKVNDDPATGRASGDFSVAYVVAHEYAHSLQAELGLIAGTAKPTSTYPVYKTELHADCWAGVWANSAYYRGVLEPGDVEEGIESTNLLGDYDVAAPSHHGTPAQRTEAFMTGYNSGEPAACDRWLLESYSRQAAG